MARLLANTLAILSIALFLKVYTGNESVTRPSQDDEALKRLAVDGRVAFAAAGLAAVMGGLVLLDRLGLPVGLMNWLGPLFAIVGLGLIGIFLRASRISGFFAAERGIPGPYVGLAMAGIAAALSLLFLPPLPSGLTGRSLAAGLIGGFLITALISGPFLRKTGALTLAGALSARFPHPIITLTTGFITALSGLALALAGFGTAVALLSAITGMSAVSALIVCAVLLALIVLPGGVGGVTWAQVLAIGLTIASLALPLIVLMARGSLPPLPYIGDAASFEQAMTRLTSLHPDLIGTSEFSVAFIIALGFCAIHSVLIPTQTAMHSADARMGSASGLIWFVIVIMLGAGSLALSTLSLQGAAGLRLADVPDILLRAAARGDLSICNAHPTSIAQLREACGNITALRSGDLVGTPLYLLSAAGELRGFGASFTSLVRAGLFALALALAAGGVMSFATTLSHDAWDRWRKQRALTSQRLAMTRLILLLTIAGATYALHTLDIDARELLAISIALTACLVAPLILLSLIARATVLEALIAVGLSLFGLAVPLAIQGTQLGFAVLAEITTIATLLGFCVAALLCLRYQKDPASEGATFVAALLHGPADVMQDDRGA